LDLLLPHKKRLDLGSNFYFNKIKPVLFLAFSIEHYDFVQFKNFQNLFKNCHKNLNDCIKGENPKPRNSDSLLGDAIEKASSVKFRNEGKSG
jgi:hypothetical protein